MIDKGLNKRKVRGGKRTKAQRDADTRFCMELYLKRYPIRDIHAALLKNLAERGMDYSISHQQVFNDIKAEMIQWKKENEEMVTEYVSLELRQLDKMERELWDSWERSKKGKTKQDIYGGKIIEGRVKGGDLGKRTMETGDGDPRYLDLILKLYERRSKLLGYNAPVTINVARNQDQEEERKYNIDVLSPEEIVAIAYRLQDGTSNKKEDKTEEDVTE